MQNFVGISFAVLVIGFVAEETAEKLIAEKTVPVVY